MLLSMLLFLTSVCGHENRKMVSRKYWTICICIFWRGGGVVNEIPWNFFSK